MTPMNAKRGFTPVDVSSQTQLPKSPNQKRIVLTNLGARNGFPIKNEKEGVTAVIHQMAKLLDYEGQKVE